uniref:50S ribosomal protein L18 n=1 Tax=Ananas comosus var. bracteatus TaxID=296719 RepID=A0A6V7NIV0_ANACO|nr:unnamed protein product [Ananas comosus var. bracteatus]
MRSKQVHSYLIRTGPDRFGPSLPNFSRPGPVCDWLKFLFFSLASILFLLSTLSSSTSSSHGVSHFLRFPFFLSRSLFLLSFPFPLKSPYNSPLGARPSSLSFASSIPLIKLSTPPRLPNPPTPLDRKAFIVQAAWTRRSRGELAKRPNRKSWKQRTDMYMRPFLLNVFFSKRFIHAKVVHRGTSKVISVASTNAKDLRNTLPSLIDNDACRTIGQLIAERSKEADVFAMSFEPKKNERIEGKLGIVLDTIKENGIIFV